ncbi:MAG: DUF2779 domain-containing protein [bacterium]
MQLSKSEYMMFLRHPALLWFKKHDKSKLPPIDEDTQAMFDAGFVFETYAEQLFLDAVRLGFDSYQEYISLTRRTDQAIRGGAKTILQGRFEAGEITCICDALVKVGENNFDLYEIKSSSAVKSDHEYDLAFQREVLEASGLKIDHIFVIHVNTEFVRNGEVRANELCKTVEVTEAVKAREIETRENIRCAIEMATSRECPDISPKYASRFALGDWLEVYRKLVEVGEYSIYDLCGIDPEKIGMLESQAIQNIKDIPEDFALNERQLRQVVATKSDEIFVDEQKVRSFLNELKFPLYFLDYETLSSVVPYFDGLSPYKQLPFQYSLHILATPESELQHFEYLHDENSNPVRLLSETLKSQIGEVGTVLVWYQPFERTCNELMGNLLPEFKDFYYALNDRIVDLMTPFAEGSYVDKRFLGSASIKKVLPVLIPELSYIDLDIHAGGAAQRLWMEAVLDGKRASEKDKILQDLWKYCELDTLAMVRIYQFLKKLQGDAKSRYIAPQLPGF